MLYISVNILYYILNVFKWCSVCYVGKVKINMVGKGVVLIDNLCFKIILGYFLLI